MLSNVCKLKIESSAICDNLSEEKNISIYMKYLLIFQVGKLEEITHTGISFSQQHIQVAYED